MQQAQDQKRAAGECLVSRHGLEQSLSDVAVNRVLSLTDSESVGLGWGLKNLHF